MVKPFNAGGDSSRITVLPLGMPITSPATGFLPPQVAGSDQRVALEPVAVVVGFGVGVIGVLPVLGVPAPGTLEGQAIKPAVTSNAIQVCLVFTRNHPSARSSQGALSVLQSKPDAKNLAFKARVFREPRIKSVRCE